MNIHILHDRNPGIRLCLALLMGFVLTAVCPAMEITDQNVAVVYETKADIPTPRENIARMISADFRQMRDEFSRHELLETLQPAIERRIAEAAKESEFSVKVGTDLEDYDFERKAFPTGTAADSFIPFDGNYVVRFSNLEAVSHVAVPIAEAKKAATALKSSRRAAITYSGTLEKCVEETINYNARKVVYLKINKITLGLEGGLQFTQALESSAP